MRDRIPTYAGRVKLTPVSIQDNIYDMERADEPLEEGTPLNKNTLLGESVEQKLGLGEEATPSDALEATLNKIDNLSKEFDEKLSEKAPSYSYGMEDLVAGTSELETGKLYFVYE